MVLAASMNTNNSPTSFANRSDFDVSKTIIENHCIWPICKSAVAVDAEEQKQEQERGSNRVQKKGFK